MAMFISSLMAERSASLFSSFRERKPLIASVMTARASLPFGSAMMSMKMLLRS